MKDNRIDRWLKEEEVVIQHRTEAGHVIESQLSLVIPFPWYQVAWTIQCFSSMYTLPIGKDRSSFVSNLWELTHQPFPWIHVWNILGTCYWAFELNSSSERNQQTCHLIAGIYSPGNCRMWPEWESFPLTPIFPTNLPLLGTANPYGLWKYIHLVNQLCSLNPIKISPVHSFTNSGLKLL